MTIKKHFKLYKSKKSWVVAPIVGLAITGITGLALLAYGKKNKKHLSK